MAGERLTEERLRAWLDGNQPIRERMCAHLLPLLGAYSQVEARRPKGGPDGGRDLQAVYGGALEVWGAVGFKNSASGSAEHRRWCSKKFKDDLRAALGANGDLKGFAFLTNVDLTPTDVASLKAHGESKGLQHCEVFALEPMRQALDSFVGVGYRLQYLDVDMSKADQVAFLDGVEARRTAEITALNEKQKNVDEKLGRLEFLNECARPVHTISLRVVLDGPATPEQLGHFRAVAQVCRHYEPSPWPSLAIGMRDSYMVHEPTGNPVYGLRTLIWAEEPHSLIGRRSRQTRRREFKVMHAEGPIFNRGPFSSLGELDRCSFNLWVTEPLLDRLAFVGLAVNEYAILGFTREALVVAEQVGLTENAPPSWPVELSEEEQRVPWKGLYLRNDKTDDPALAPPFRHSSREIHFSEYTPFRHSLPAWRGGRLWGNMAFEME